MELRFYLKDNSIILNLYFFSLTTPPKLSEDTTSLNTSHTGNAKNKQNTPARMDGIIPTIVEPIDYENYTHRTCIGMSGVEIDDPVMEFPNGSNDIDVYVLARKVRTIIPAGPEEDMYV